MFRGRRVRKIQGKRPSILGDVAKHTRFERSGSSGLSISPGGRLEASPIDF